MTSPDVSIVIPTYNRAKTLGRAIDSGLAQVFDGALEVIVVDNASQDRTDLLMQSYETVRFQRWSENLGPVENWRRGISLARADWIKIIWSDDWLEPNCVRELHAAATQAGAVAATCRAMIHYPESDAPSYTERRAIFDGGDAVAGLLGRRALSLPVSPAAALVRRSDALRGLDAVDQRSLCARRAIGPDVALLYWGVLNGGRGVHVPKLLAHFDGRGTDSITMNELDEGGWLLRACYDSSVVELASAAGLTIPPDLMRLVRHRAALAKVMGASEEALHHPRLSVREGARSLIRRVVNR